MTERLLTGMERDAIYDMLTQDERTWSKEEQDWVRRLHLCQAQDTKGHAIDLVEVRQATLKEVGEWLLRKEWSVTSVDLAHQFRVAFLHERR